MHLHGLTGSRKTACESRLSCLYQYAWYAWTVQECTGYNLDFSCCANKDGFHRDSHECETVRKSSMDICINDMNRALKFKF